MSVGSCVIRQSVLHVQVLCLQISDLNLKHPLKQPTHMHTRTDRHNTDVSMTFRKNNIKAIFRQSDVLYQEMQNRTALCTCNYIVCV